MNKKLYYIIGVIVILALLMFLVEEFTMLGFFIVPLLIIIGIPAVLLYFIFRIENKQKMKIALGIFAFFILVPLIVLVGAYISENNSKQERNDLVLKIKNSLDNNNYGDAYDLYNKLKVIGGSYDKKEIVKKEAIYLVSQNTEESANRILYLLAQELSMDEADDLIVDVYTLAKKVNNTFIVDKLKEDYENIQNKRDSLSTSDPQDMK